jgi:hypothetical protein
MDTFHFFDLLQDYFHVFGERVMGTKTVKVTGNPSQGVD